MLSKIIEQYSEKEFLIADGFDNAVIGIDEKTMRLIYSVSKCLEILIENSQQGMSYEEAEEFFEFNVSGAYVGEKTPIWSYDIF